MGVKNFWGGKKLLTSKNINLQLSPESKIIRKSLILIDLGASKYERYFRYFHKIHCNHGVCGKTPWFCGNDEKVFVISIHLDKSILEIWIWFLTQVKAKYLYFLNLKVFYPSKVFYPHFRILTRCAISDTSTSKSKTWMVRRG